MSRAGKRLGSSALASAEQVLGALNKMKNEFPADGWDWLRAVLFPPKCLCCEERVPPDRLFCRSCANKLPDEPNSRLIHLDNGWDVPVLAPLSYEGGYRETMLLYKFAGYRILALRIGILIADLVKGLPERNWVVTYVPLSPEGLRDRGYDQSELLAWQVARHNGLEVQRLLEKVKKTKTQHDLGLEERLTNLLGAYRASERAKGKDILLVDDIVTSGSTLKECASVLHRAGARSICCLCAAGSRVEHAGMGRNEEREAGELWRWI